jgi:hypothetical protein
MQKLASSSVAAIRRAIERRLDRLCKGSTAPAERPDTRAVAGLDADLLDEQQPAVEQVASLPDLAVALMRDEIKHLEVLLAAARAVTRETKIDRLIEIVGARFPHDQVLFFTEYKATQAVVMSALQSKYSDGCVSFINGDEQIDGVVSRSGKVEQLRESRTAAAERFNSGQVRFLISTEAGGEGIDLQHRCHSLIHVDLPWNPMRLHQRVGRLNRYGQQHAVEVVTLRNPDTVESLIWDKLNEKLHRIMLALGNAMDDPEDLLQLVLGMAGSAIFDELFAEGTRVRREQVADWFDSKTGTFGGQAAIETVRALVGHATKFDYQGLGDIPKTDLPALSTFFENALRQNGRKPMWKDGKLSFVTPEPWIADRGVRRKYENLVFSRSGRGEDVIGIGHRAFDQALRQALASAASMAGVRGLLHPVVVFQIFDEVTEHTSALQTSAVGVTVGGPANNCELLTDLELLELLNSLSSAKAEPYASQEEVSRACELAECNLRTRLRDLRLPFVAPALRMQAVLWPI